MYSELHLKHLSKNIITFFTSKVWDCNSLEAIFLFSYYTIKYKNLQAEASSKQISWAQRENELNKTAKQNQTDLQDTQQVHTNRNLVFLI